MEVLKFNYKNATDTDQEKSFIGKDEANTIRSSYQTWNIFQAFHRTAYLVHMTVLEVFLPSTTSVAQNLHFISRLYLYSKSVHHEQSHRQLLASTCAATLFPSIYMA